MAKEINEKGTMTLSDTTGINEAIDNMCSLLDNAVLTYQETANPESCEKPHFIVSVQDAQTSKVTAVCCLFVSARMENGDEDSINVAKILNRQRDSLMAAGLHENVRIVGIACLPNLSADRHALHLLNQVPDYILYKEDYEQYQNEPSLFAAKLEKCIAKDAERLAERSPFLKKPSGMDEDDLNTILDNYYKREISLAGKSGEQHVNEMLCSLQSAACYMSPYCIDDSNVCDHVLLDKNGFVIIETKNWHEIKSVRKSKVEIAEGVVRPNPDKQVQRYKDRLTAEMLRKYPYYSADFIQEHIRCVIWLPQVKRSSEVEEAFETPVIFRGDGEKPIILQEKLNSLFTGGEPLSGAAYQDFRRMLEPSYTPCLPIEGDYSELRVWDADEFTPEDAKRAVMSWMEGTKQVHFFQSHEDLEVLRRQLSDSMAERNISVSPENPFELCLGDNAPGAATGNENYMQLFRYEAYVLPPGEYPKMLVINGEMTNHEKAELLAIQNRQIELLKSGIDCGVYSFEQFEAEHCRTDCNIAVGAGAGTGKTFLLVAKTAYLLYFCSKSGITSLLNQIVMLTFTNKAADVMRERIRGMLFSFFALTSNLVFMRCIEELAQMKILTIDSFFETLIQQNPTAIGIGGDCKVTSSTYKYRQILDEKIAQHFPNELDHAYYDADLREAVYSIGETILKKGADVRDCTIHFPEHSDHPLAQWLREMLPMILSDAQTEFDEFLRDRNMLLLNHFSRDALHCIQSAGFNPNFYDIRYVFVDEFQDTSSNQIAVLRGLQSKLSFPIFIVGDTKQSIYAFRGASPNAFREMMQDNGQWQTYQLTINRRSTGALIDCTNWVCEQIWNISGGNLPIFEKKNSALQSIRNSISRIQTFPLTSMQTSETVNEFIAKIQDLQKEQPELFRNAAILTRFNQQVQMLTAAANRVGLNVEAVTDNDSGDFYSQPPVLDLYFMLAALTHPRQPAYLFALLLTNFFRVGQLRRNTDMPKKSDAVQAIVNKTGDLMGFLEAIITQQDAPEQALRSFMNDGHISYTALRNLTVQYLTEQNARKYAPFYPDALGEDKYAALVEIINACLAKYAADEPYLQDWDSLCKETSNAGAGTSILKIIYAFFSLTQPWNNYRDQRKKEQYIANFKLLFESVAEECCHNQMTVDTLFESLKLRIMTHQSKDAATVSTQSEAVKCMTIHKSKGLEFDTVFLFAGEPANREFVSNCCDVNRRTDGKYDVEFRMRLKPIGSRSADTIASLHYHDIVDQDEEWRVLYVALTRAKSNLIAGYIDRDDNQLNPWNLILHQMNVPDERSNHNEHE